MMLDDIGTLLAGAGLGLTLQTNFYLVDMRDTPDSAVSLDQTGGVAPIDQMGQGKPQVERPRLQVRCRDFDAQAAETKSYAIWNVLSAVVNQTLSGTFYHRISPIDAPSHYYVDENGRHYWATNYQVVKNA